MDPEVDDVLLVALDGELRLITCGNCVFPLAADLRDHELDQGEVTSDQSEVVEDQTRSELDVHRVDQRRSAEREMAPAVPPFSPNESRCGVR